MRYEILRGVSSRQYLVYKLWAEANTLPEVYTKLAAKFDAHAYSYRVRDTVLDIDDIFHNCRSVAGDLYKYMVSPVYFTRRLIHHGLHILHDHFNRECDMYPILEVFRLHMPILCPSIFENAMRNLQFNAKRVRPDIDTLVKHVQTVYYPLFHWE